MTQDKITIKAPAKINLFLHIFNKRDDGYHNIKSGITFINLYDEVCIKKNNSMIIQYSGTFKPAQDFFDDCIIKKTLKFLNLDNKTNLEININKNIPTQAGLGSASSNAAALIKGLNKLKIIKMNEDYKFYSKLGADIPVFLYGKNAFVEGIGEKVFKYDFPKYFFLLVKPETGFSTKKMYNKISENLQDDNIANHNNNIVNDYGNDFENIAIRENEEINKILKYLSESEKCIISQMTGSGSCCFAAYEKQEDANKAQISFKEYFPKLWSFVGENNTINN
jgi:4-diphosphocytidyl-2-C-methyl-D-erythritol kinase|tara:strand:- start:65 stop:904 length:840 start_codon:yes stop_codon:yes gene_type:complete